MQGVLGVLFLIAISWAFCTSKSSIDWGAIAIGFVVHVLLTFTLLNLSFVSESLLILNSLVSAVEEATRSGTQFVFGFLGGGRAPFDVTDPDQIFVFAFNVLPQVLIFTVLVALLWHWRILPFFVKGMGFLLSNIFRVKGPLATAGASSLFLGMVEAPLVVRAYLASMSRSDFFALMTLGMSTVAGSVLVLYASVLSSVSDVAVSQIVSASFLNIVGALYISRLFEPEIETAADQSALEVSLSYESSMDALAQGTRDGIGLAVNVGAMVLVLVSLVALVNIGLSFIEVFGVPLSLEMILGWMFSPIAWLIGIPWEEASIGGSLLGTKLVLNELVAFIRLAEIGADLSDSSVQILIFALCGFANFGSLGILLGGLYILVPERSEETIKIAPKSVISGTIVTLMTASIVSISLSY